MANKKIFLNSFSFNKSFLNKKTLNITLKVFENKKRSKDFNISLDNENVNILFSTPVEFFTKNFSDDITVGTFLLNISRFLSGENEFQDFTTLEFHCLDSENGNSLDFNVKTINEQDEIISINKEKNNTIKVHKKLMQNFILEVDNYFPKKIQVNGMKDGFFIFVMQRR